MSCLHEVFERHGRSVQWCCVLEQHNKGALRVCRNCIFMGVVY